MRHSFGIYDSGGMLANRFWGPAAPSLDPGLTTVPLRRQYFLCLDPCRRRHVSHPRLRHRSVQPEPGADGVEQGPIRGHIFIGHTHWDHIQGLPFFAPLFVAGNEFDIYAPCGFGPAA